MKYALITGASSGIGYTTAKALIQHNYHVFGSVRKTEDAERLQKEFGSQFTALLFDVTDAAAVEQAAEVVRKTLNGKGLAALVNNAGIAIGGPMMHIPIEELSWQLEVNVLGLVRTTQVFLPFLGAQKDCPFPPGKIYNISSVAGKIVNPFMGPYCASKHAVEAISQAFRIELQLYGIDVVVIGPGVVKTPIWDKAEDLKLERYDNTDYKESSQAMQRLIEKVSTRGYEQEEFGEMMAKIIANPQPKTRYALVYKKLMNWTLPKLISDKSFAKIVAKRIGLLK